MTLQRMLPVISSILIILGVAFLRERSRTLAAILATMPINIPLGMWVLFGSGDFDPSMAQAFIRALVPGLAATVVWVLVVWLMTGMGVSLGLSILSGYAVWGALVIAFIRLGWLTVP